MPEVVPAVMPAPIAPTAVTPATVVPATITPTAVVPAAVAPAQVPAAPAAVTPPGGCRLGIAFGAEVGRAGHVGNSRTNRLQASGYALRRWRRRRRLSIGVYCG